MIFYEHKINEVCIKKSNECHNEFIKRKLIDTDVALNVVTRYTHT